MVDANNTGSLIFVKDVDLFAESFETYDLMTLVLRI